jgi:DNA modification methylase
MVTVKLLNGDCKEKLKELADNSIDSIVVDPPYGLSKEPDMIEVLTHWLAGDDYTHSSKGFMGKTWDSFVPSPSIWKECLRVLKPGGYMVSFFGTRTYDMGVLSIRIAGFEIRDQLAWVYGSGFPKSMAVDKAIDKHFKAERTIKKGVKQGHEEFANRTTKGHLSGENKNEGWARPWMEADDANDYHYDFEPATEDAKKWVGWGTALKPAFEPIVLARKPLIGTVAENVLKHGVGGININDTRIPINPEIDDPRLGGKGTWKTDGMAKNVYAGGYAGIENGSSALGRFPSNFMHDGSEEVVELFPQSKGQQGDVKGTEKSHTGQNGIYNEYGRVESQKRGDSGSAARFFYCAKASKSDRNFGLDDFEEASIGAKGNGIRRVCETCGASSLESHLCKCSEKNWVNPANKKNIHPTVKPTELMKYLVKMVTPVGGTVLDPFMGSGSTGKAAVSEGFNFVGIEMQKEYYDIAEARINHAMLPKVEEPKIKKEKKPKSTPILPSALFE